MSIIRYYAGRPVRRSTDRVPATDAGAQIESSVLSSLPNGSPGFFTDGSNGGMAGASPAAAGRLASGPERSTSPDFRQVIMLCCQQRTLARQHWSSDQGQNWIYRSTIVLPIVVTAAPGELVACRCLGEAAGKPVRS